jgi:VCBS repeat-containing protein
MNATPLFTASPSTLSTSQNYTEGGSATTGLFLSAAANVGIGDIEGSLLGQQLFQSVTLQVSNVFTGDQLRIDGVLVNVDATTTSSIAAGTYKVDVTVADGISTVVISRDPIDISSANLQTLVENIGYASTSNNPTAFGSKLTRGITIHEVTDNAGTVISTDDESVLPDITATVAIATVNTPVVANADTGTATEGSAPVLATGNVRGNDIDPDSITTVTKVGGTTLAVSGTTDIVGTYGTLTIGADGAYSYAADNANTLVNSLNVGSPSLTDTFTYTVSDGPSSTTATITIGINGGNNSATIGGQITGLINESVTVLIGTTTTGLLTADDLDNPDDTWTPSTGSTTHGSYAINAGGEWTFTLDNSNSSVDGLNVGSSFTDTFTVATFDGTTQTVSVAIRGRNDAAVVGGDISGSIDESVTVLTGTTTTGTLTSADVDNTTAWISSTGSTAHGSYGLDSLGAWTYTLGNGNSAVDALNVGGSFVDTFTVTTVDGTSQTVNVTINGQNDAAVVTSNDFTSGIGLVTGDVGVNVLSNLSNTDDRFNTISLGSDTFNFYGTTYNQLFVSNNGLITFGSGNTNFVNTNLSTPLPQSAIAVFWDDLVTFDSSSSQVLYTIQDGKLIIEWSEVDYVSDAVSNPNTITFQAILTLNTGSNSGEFTLQYIDLDGGSSQNNGVSATVGVSRPGEDPILVSFNSSTNPLVASGQAITFFPSGSSAFSASPFSPFSPFSLNSLVASINESTTVLTGTTFTGTLVSTDVDNLNTFTEATGTTAHGSYGLDSLGALTYTLDNGNTTVDALNVGEYFLDTFTITTIDGTSQVVGITINGQNDAAIVSGDTDLSINESVTVLTGTTITGTLVSTDVDDLSTFIETTGTTDHGSYGLDSLGALTYTLDNGNTAVDALNVGGSFVDTFTVSTIDGTIQTVSVTINGQNDDAVITSGAASYQGSLTEASGLNNATNNTLPNSQTTGTVTYTDVDDIGSAWVATNAPVVTASQKGSYSIDANGTWVYDLNNNYGDVQALQTGQSTTDTFTITTTGGTTQTVTVTITGGNDLPTVTNPANLSGTVIEAGGVTNGTLNTPTASKNLNFTDPDNVSDVWTPVTSGAATVGGYGTYGIDAFGQWTYNLDNGNSAVNALNVGGSLVDTFNVTTNDGTTQSVSVTISGRNDAAVITGTLNGSVTERSGLSNAINGTGSITNTVIISDVDSTASLTTVTPLTNTLSGLGQYATSGNQWTYQVNEQDFSVQSLNVGQSTTDTFAITTADGTTANVTVIINGANDAAIVSGDINNKSVTEDNGIDNNIPGTPTATGNLTYSDIDNSGTDWIPQSSVFTGNFGIYSITNTGSWTYTVNNNNGLVDGLQAGQSLTDSFVVATTGGTPQTVTVKILGQNDSAIVTGQTTAALNESGLFTAGAAAGNNLNYTDPDNIDDGWTPVSAPTLATGGHGNYTIDADGVWSYSLLTGNNIVESLAAGVTVVDTFVATTTDGTTQTVSVTITGENDAAVITNATTAAFGSLTEAGGLNNGTAGTTFSADLNATDVDNIPDSWNAVTTLTNATQGYGQYSIDANGVWNYVADNGNSDVQGLNVGTSLVDTFAVSTIDGTTQTVTVTINGANDTASFTGIFTDSVTEASGVSNGTAGTGIITQDVTVTDVDNSELLNNVEDNSSYGSYVVDNNIESEGSPFWSYTVDEENTAVQALNFGQTLVDTFSISAVDGTTQAVTITINGENDAAEITNAMTAAFGSLTEAGGLDNGTAGTTFSADLNATDVDNTPDTWTAVTTLTNTTLGYGQYSIGANGVWNYVANNGNSDVQGLNVGTSLVDTFAVSTIDGTTQTVTVTINGADDTAVVSNFTGAVIEAGGINNGTPGMMTATDTLSIVDPDNSYDGWSLVGAGYGNSLAGDYGYINLTAFDGADWTYTLDNDDVDTQALTAGQTVTETFVAINGGLSQTVTITVTGTNDNPALTGEPSDTPLATYTENAVYTITKAQLLEGYSDVDAGEAATLSIANLQALDGANNSIGSFTFNGVNTYTFAPINPDYYGVVNLAYNVQDANLGTVAATSSFTITPVNDAPTVINQTVVNLAAINEDTINPAGDTVANLFGSSFSDAQDNPAPDTFAGIAITTISLNPSQGAWQWFDNTNGWQPINAVSDSGALFLAPATLLRFLPAANYNGTPGSIIARVVEPGALNLAGNPVLTGDLLNASTGASSGGTSHVSNAANTVTLSTTVNSVDDDPTVITGNTAGTVTEDTSIIFSGSLIATDPDVSGPLFTPVINQNGANNYGQFTILSNGNWQYNLDNNNPLVQHLGAANTLTDTYTFNTSTGASETVRVTINGSIDAGVSITGNAANETINGRDGNDYLNGGLGNDSLIGGLGNDVLDGGGDSAGLDTFAGGAGDDVYGVYNSATTITENVNEGNDTVWTAVNYTLANNVENLYVVGALTGTGNSGDNLIVGFGADNQTLLGLDGNDIMYGGDGNDNLIGGLGNDYVDGGAGNDVLDGAGDSAGLDTFAGGAGDDVYGVYNSATTITENVNEGNDTVWTAVNYTLANNVENLYVVGALTGIGNSGDNLIVGFGADNQTLLGLDGDDIMYGGDGNDNLIGGLGNDYVDGGAGNDVLDGAGDSAGLDTFAGGAGDDIYGIYNSATMIVENATEGTDTVWTAVNYALTNEVENLFLVGNLTGTGNSGNNLIVGFGVGDNTIDGGAGADTIDGGAGTDVISGGTGADIFTFVFTQSTATATDRITDFEIGTDKLDIFTPAGVAASPTSFSRAGDDSTSINLSNLASVVYANADGAGNSLAAGAAALVVSTGSIAGTYVVIDDGVAGFNAADDLVINITGYTGTLTTNPTSVSSFFKV